MYADKRLMDITRNDGIYVLCLLLVPKQIWLNIIFEIFYLEYLTIPL